MKKVLFVALVVAILAAGAHAAKVQKKVTSWTWTKIFDPKETCVMNLKMKIGWWFKVDSCGDIELIQEGSSTSYSGCRNIKVWTNFPAQWTATVAPGDVVKAKSWSGYFKDGEDSVSKLQTEEGNHTIKVCARAKEVDHMGNADGIAGTKQTVGKLTLWVAPQPITGTDSVPTQ
jgi:hypothetical protein